MDLAELRRIRKRRLRSLVEEFGSQDALAEKIDTEQNYISKLLKPGSPFGERTARSIETKTGKPPRWLDTDEEVAQPQAVADWPFSFDRSYWDRLAPAQKREIDDALQKMVLGASVQEMARPKRKPA